MTKLRNYHPRQTALVVLIASILITQGIAFGIYSAERNRAKLQAHEEVINIKNHLDRALNHSTTAAEMMRFLVEKDLIGNDFDTVAAELLARNDFIDALQLVKDKEIIKTYPLAGNEPTIGYAIMEVPHHRKSALTALERNELYFEGPFELKQGGIGIVGRLPIYINSEYWGFSAVIIRLETFLKALGIDATGRNHNYAYQLVKIQEGTDEVPFFEANTHFRSGIFGEAFIPIGDWKIYAQMVNPGLLWKTLPFALLGLGFSVLLAWFSWYLTNEPLKLKLLVDQKTHDLDQSNTALLQNVQKLDASNKELEQFAYVASHDLQEPLRMISSFMHLLRKRYGEQLDSKAHEYMRFAEDGARRLQQIILDLLEFAKIGSENTEKATIDLNQLIREYRSLREHAIAEKKVRLTTDELPVITSYPVPITQLFNNLIDNAIKYANPERTPEIHIGAKDRVDSWEFSVADNGIGIDPEYFDKIFVLFQRLHSNEAYSGTGIGLSVVKKVLDHLGGDIRVESEPGKGTKFTFTVPK